MVEESSIGEQPEAMPRWSVERATINCLKVGKKVVFVLFVLILISLLMIQTAQCLTLYISKPTYTETVLINQKYSEFPAFTICPEGGGYKEDVLKVR